MWIFFCLVNLINGSGLFELIFNKVRFVFWFWLISIVESVLLFVSVMLIFFVLLIIWWFVIIYFVGLMIKLEFNDCCKGVDCLLLGFLKKNGNLGLKGVCLNFESCICGWDWIWIDMMVGFIWLIRFVKFMGVLLGILKGLEVVFFLLKVCVKGVEV